MKRSYSVCKALALVCALAFSISTLSSCCSVPVKHGSPPEYSSFTVNGEVKPMLDATIAVKTLEGRILGSGVVIRHRAGEPLIILTAKHVTDAVDDVMYISDCVHNCNDLIAAHTIKRGDGVDLAMVVSDDKMESDGPEAPIASVEPSIGDAIYIVGSPNGHNFNLSHGLLSSVYVSHGLKMYRTDAPVYFGNSGGPAFYSARELVGIVIQLEGMSVGDELSGVVPGSGTLVPLDTIVRFVYGSNGR